MPYVNLNGQLVQVTQEQFDAWIEWYDTFIKETKAQRFIQIPKDFYKNDELPDLYSRGIITADESAKRKKHYQDKIAFLSK